MRFFIALGIGVLAGCSGDPSAVDDGEDANVAPPDGSQGDSGSKIDGTTSDAAIDGGGGDVTTSDGGGDVATNDDASAGDGSVTTSDGASDGDTDAAPIYPAGRLFVSMAGSPLGVWDKSSSITADVPPTFTLSDPSVTSGTLGLALAKKRLIVGTTQATGAILAFDGADALTGSAPPAAKIPASQLLAPSPTCTLTSQLTWDAKSDSLWVGHYCGTEHFSGASAISSSSSATALFTHPWYQLPGVAYDPIGDRLFLGQISGAGLLAYNSASSASGAPSPSFVLSQSSAAWSMTIAGDRLYASMGSASTIAVWNGISGVSAAKAPDFTMGTLSGLSGFPQYVGVNGDVLVACMQSGIVHLWTHASALGGDAMPTQSITIANPTKALIGPLSGRLYVMDDKGIAIYDTPTTAPTLVARITSGIVNPTDFAVLE
jgi:hypothetical protein